MERLFGKKRNVRQMLLGSSGALCIAVLFCAPLRAQNKSTVTQCAGQALTVRFQVDCSHVADPATKALCPVFAQNQACKVFPAYQQITGIHLQDWCSTVQYVIYDKDKWSKSGAPGGAGGYTVGCRTQYMADYSLLLKSEIGPYDVHEILHDYQIALGALPYTHILFAPSMVEATRLIGDSERYAALMKDTRRDMDRIQDQLERRAVAPDTECLDAELTTEFSLYLKDPNNVRQFYLVLTHDGEMRTRDPQSRFDQMYDKVSGGTARPYLLQHGCRFF